MITPRFSCSQTDSSVIASIYCPSVRASEVEINVDDTLLSVHIAPYYLRLNFPSNVLEDDDSSAVYDPSSGYLTVTLTKENKGQNFPDLDLLAKLLAPRAAASETPQGPTIEVVSSHTSDGPETADEDDLVDSARALTLDDSTLTEEQREILQAAENDWQLPQTVPDALPELYTTLQKPYGFLDAYTGFFRHVANTENEVNELGPDAETLSPSERRQRRIQHEEAKWDEDYYMADYADNPMIDEVLAWEHPLLSSADDAPFTESENMAMLRLPRKEYLMNASQTQNIYLTLITILFAYTYDARFTQHDPTPESAWTICSLTPAFSALDPAPYALAPGSPDVLFKSALTACYRRALAFPLYRSWALAEACRKDTARILSRGTRTVLRCLLETRAILDANEVYYVYSRIWLDDLCSWVQTASEDELKAIGRAIQGKIVDKGMLGWDLEALEKAADAALTRDADSDDESEDEVERMMPTVL
ncbi:SHQ1-domain-containing protein [Amylostereum chailletii]|nr:SHQ1-domain-containing protein [Amylostereum chailletii]